MVTPFDVQASRDLEAFEVASTNLREAWRILTIPGRRNVQACAVILEIAAILGDIHNERRRIEAASTEIVCGESMCCPLLLGHLRYLT